MIANRGSYRPDIDRTIRYWQSTGVVANTVMESITGRKPAGKVGWQAVKDYLARRSEPAADND